MKKMLVTGGTVFVSRYAAEYYAAKGYEVYVLNRNTKPQPDGVHLLEGDRHDLGTLLKDFRFDIVLDVTAYKARDIIDLINGLNEFEQYIMISSSAVYPETEKQPFSEESALGVNKFWGQYGTDKIEAEQELLKRIPEAYIIRPPYLYGPMNNVYREAFVFDCALKNRPFYLPADGKMKLQFFYIEDLCRFIDRIIEDKPDCHIYNVGNKDTVTIRDWVELCYRIVGKEPEFVNVDSGVEQRKYFSFYHYEYYLDVSKQYSLMPDVTSIENGLEEAYKWYLGNADKVNMKPYFAYIDENLA